MKNPVTEFKVRALMRFSSMVEGNVSKGQEWNTTRDRAYALMGAGHVEILSGDRLAGDFETHSAPLSSSPLGLAASRTARQIGQIGQPSPSTMGGNVTPALPPSTPPTNDGGKPAESQADPVTSSESAPASPAKSTPARSGTRGTGSKTSRTSRSSTRKA
jgi:hypothetical protein